MLNQSKVFVVACLAALSVACGASQKSATPPVAAAPTTSAAGSADASNADGLNAASSMTADLTNGSGAFDPLYFAFDSSELKSESQDALKTLATYMGKSKVVTVTIAGHTDERGTPEYNLALGERRAQVARAYLMRLGVDAQRVHVVSYGKERPALVGDGEAVWAKNRRDELQVASTDSTQTSANP